MAHPIQEIPYIPPQKSARDYAHRALGLLREFEKLDSRLLAYMLAPTNVLVLAGLRSFSPYNDRINFDIDTQKFNKLLANRGLLWLNENPNADNSDLASYALINFEVANHLHDTYPLKALTLLGKVPDHSNWGFFAWVGAFDIAFARTIESNTLPKQWLEDWWSPHNIRFGMLLGYPGVAISSFIQSEITEMPQDREVVTISPGLFKSPNVSFITSKASKGREDVATMVQTWQDTLTVVYATYPKKLLMKDAIFARVVNAKQ